ncbi:MULTISPECIES: hypothetical protein [Spirulina sp. CCY15215]|uniref:hypothetical protein n=1 Tax=Spirulina sp. CCY15215 TaxID=2767591 RepID=UPI00195080A3|nr:hypothetical protein [Spirulina major]
MSNQALSRSPLFPPTQVLTNLNSGQLFFVKAAKGGGIIVCHPHHAEILGPGAAVGGMLDLDCRRLVPLGKVALTYPESYEQRRQSFLIRQKWVGSAQKAIKHPVPLKRAYLMVMMLEKYFGCKAIAALSDEILASIAGVLPNTMAIARQQRKQVQPAPQQRKRQFPNQKKIALSV